MVKSRLTESYEFGNKKRAWWIRSGPILIGATQKSFKENELVEDSRGWVGGKGAV